MYKTNNQAAIRVYNEEFYPYEEGKVADAIGGVAVPLLVGVLPTLVGIRAICSENELPTYAKVILSTNVGIMGTFASILSREIGKNINEISHMLTSGAKGIAGDIPVMAKDVAGDIPVMLADAKLAITDEVAQWFDKIPESDSDKKALDHMALSLFHEYCSDNGLDERSFLKNPSNKEIFKFLDYMRDHMNSRSTLSKIVGRLVHKVPAHIEDLGGVGTSQHPIKLARDEQSKRYARK